MELDTTELVMTVEEAFDITIDDRDAERIRTVGDLHRYILRKVGDKPTVCPSAALFYRLRGALIGVADVDRRAIRPSTRVEDLLPEDVRGASWAAIRRALGPSVPRLPHPSWSRALAALACPVAFLTTMAASWLMAVPTFDFFLFLVFGSGILWLGLAAAIFQVGSRFATTLPPGCETVGGVIRATLPGGDPPVAAGPGTPWEPEEVRDYLRAILVDLAGVRPDEVTEDAQFVDNSGD